MKRFRDLLAVLLLLLGQVTQAWALATSVVPVTLHSPPAQEVHAEPATGVSGCPSHAQAEPLVTADPAIPADAVCQCPDLCLCATACGVGGSPAGVGTLAALQLPHAARAMTAAAPDATPVAAHRGDPFRPPAAVTTGIVAA